jgi:flagellum-specific peptidoglycan hydrolase FlgJ
MKKWLIDISIVLIVFCLGVLFYPIISRVEHKSPEIIKIDSVVISNEELQYLFDKHKIRFSHIVMAQAILESGNFTSTVFKSNNNFMGMKVAAQRYSFAANPHDYGSYAKYETVEDCVRDIKSWQIQNAFFLTKDEEYFLLLQKIYAEDSDYINKLKKIVK